MARLLSYTSALPILHMTLGIVQNLYNKMTEFLSDEEKEDVENILTAIGAVRSSYHGHAFEGRGVHAILDNLQMFPQCVKRTSSFNALKYYDVFLQKCGGITRGLEWQQSVEDFLIAFKQTGLRPFLKVHVITHVPQYFTILDSFCKYENPGLAWLSEQAIESCHRQFKDTWNRFKSTPKSKNALLLAVKDFNYVRFLTAFSE